MKFNLANAQSRAHPDCPSFIYSTGINGTSSHELDVSNAGDELANKPDMGPALRSLGRVGRGRWGSVTVVNSYLAFTE